MMETLMKKKLTTNGHKLTRMIGVHSCSFVVKTFLVISVSCVAFSTDVLAQTKPLAMKPEVTEALNPAPIAPSMTLSNVLAQVWKNNPQILAARAEYDATGESISQAQAGWKPTVAAGANVTDVDISEGATGADGTTSKEGDISLSQPIYRGGRTIAQTQSAQAAVMAQRGYLMDAEQTVLLSAVTAYMNVIRDRALSGLAESNRDLIAEQLKATKARFDVGELTKTDVAQAESRLAGAEAAWTRAKGDVQASLAVFEDIVGSPASDTLAMPQESTPPLPTTMNEALSYADKHNPALIAAKYLEKSAERDVRTVFGELLPEVGVSGSVAKTYDPQPGNLDDKTARTVMLSASVPLYEAGAVRSRVRQAKHTHRQRGYEIQDAQRQTRQDTVSKWEEWQAAKAEILSRKSQVDAAKVAREGVHAEADIGSRTILDTLDADQEYTDAQAALITAKRNEAVARFALGKALGILRPEALDLPETR
jgi:TolC family type I secretion outer membrane protein